MAILNTYIKCDLEVWGLFVYVVLFVFVFKFLAVPDSALRDYLDGLGRPYVVSRIEPRLAACTASALPSLLSFQSPKFRVLFKVFVDFCECRQLRSVGITSLRESSLLRLKSAESQVCKCD